MDLASWQCSATRRAVGLGPKTAPSIRVLFTSAVVSCVAMTVGCAGNYRMMTAGPAHFGIGWFATRNSAVMQSTQKPPNRPLSIDLKGIGLLIAPSGWSLGYARINYVAVACEDNAHVRLSSLEIFTGDEADLYARTGWPAHFELTNSPETRQQSQMQR